MDSSKNTIVKKKKLKGEGRGGLYTEEYFWRLILLSHMLYWQYSFVYTEREFSKTNALDLSFIFIFLSRWINSNKF